jgi:hypothetical protein
LRSIATCGRRRGSPSRATHTFGRSGPTGSRWTASSRPRAGGSPPTAWCGPTTRTASASSSRSASAPNTAAAGLGAAVCTFALRQWYDEGGRQAIVYCQSEPACALYDSLGFRRHATLIGYARP